MAHCVRSNSTGVESEGGWVPVTWDVPLVDNDEMSDGGTKLVINTPGMYIVRARFFWLPAYSGAAWGWPADGTANASDNSARKAGVIAATKALGKKLAKIAILVNGIAPAAIETPQLTQMSPRMCKR